MSKSKTTGSVKIHPAAELFPMMGDSEYAGLLEDIKVNGLNFSVVFRGDELIDGRNRLRAIQDLGWDLSEYSTTVEPSEIADPIQYVLSLNLHRRHLNESQRGMVASRVATLRNTDNQHSMSQKEGSPIGLPSTQQQAADSLNVGLGTVKRARRVIDKAVQEIVDAVEHGDVSVSAAAEVSELPKAEQRKLAKAGPKAVKDAAAKSRKAKEPKPRKPGQPSGGTTFDPSEWEEPSKEEPIEVVEPVGKVPSHLTEVMAGVKDGQKLVRDIQMVLRNAKAYVDTAAGAWLAVKWSNVERDIKQLEMDAKLSQFECNCPNCKNKPTKACGKCAGRGWIDRRHASMLTNDEKKWVEANK